MQSMKKLACIIIAAAVVTALPACATGGASPTPLDTFEPIVSMPVETAKILVPNSIPSAIKYDTVMQSLNDALKAHGQNVEFELRTVTYNSGNSFVQKAREELAAGKPSADAYAMGYDDSLAFFQDGLTMDVTELVQQNASIYYSKYENTFEKRLSGIPVGIYGKPVWMKTALILRKDFQDAGAGISTLDGLFRFLDDSVAASGKQYMVLAEPGVLVNQWALEQGYYRLDQFGVYGYLFAAINDSQCTPVPLESIPGFEGFIKAMKDHYKAGVLDDNIYTVYSKEPVGFVKDLGDYYISNPFGWLSWIPGEFSAQLFSPELPAAYSSPTYVSELSIPAVCPPAKAAGIASFVEWYNSTQENYDVVLYGQTGTDFNAEGTRFSPLKDGKKQSLISITQMSGLFFTWPGATMLSNNEFIRLPASAPANVEQLYDSGIKSGQRFTADRYLKNDRETMVKMGKLGAGLGEVVSARSDALNGLIYASPYTYTDAIYTGCMDKLGKLSTDRLVDDYIRLIREFMKK